MIEVSKPYRLSRSGSKALKEAIQTEIQCAARSWCTIRSHCKQHGVAIENADIEVAVHDIRQCRQGVAFGEFLTIFAVSTWHLAVATSRNSPKQIIATEDVETLHFLERKHLDDLDTETIPNWNVQLQSVLVRNNPCQLECYANIMVSFGTSIFLAAGLWRNGFDWKTPIAPELEPPKAPIGILGMGANVVTRCLASGMPQCDITVVEMEPAVVDVCRAETLMPTQPQHCKRSIEYVVGDASKELASLPNNCSMIMLDCFDPFAETMIHAEKLLRGCRGRLGPDGVLVVNAHIYCDSKSMLPFLKVFGSGAVHAAQVKGYRQAIVVCLKTALGEGHVGARHQGVKQLRAVARGANEVTLSGPLHLDEDLVFGSRQVKCEATGAFWRLWLSTW